jgi:hypothetical protein
MINKKEILPSIRLRRKRRTLEIYEEEGEKASILQK